MVDYVESLSLGEVVIDATASKWSATDAVIVLDYPKFIAYRKREESRDSLLVQLLHGEPDDCDWAPAEGFTHNLQPC